MWMADLSMAIGAFDRVSKVLQLPAHVVASRHGELLELLDIFDRKSFARGTKIGRFYRLGTAYLAVWSCCFEYNNSMPLILIRNSIERYGKAREKQFKTSDCCGFPKLLKQPNNGITQN